MSPSKKNKTATGKKKMVKIPRLPLLIGLLVFVALILFVILHVGDEKKFLKLLYEAEPAWLLLVILFQVATYASVGATWYIISRASGYVVNFGQLARLSLEKLSIDQLIPAVGMSGNLMVYQSMKRLGIPRRVAMESILINILSHYVAYALVAVMTILLLWSRHKITVVLLSLSLLFAIILIAVPSMILWLVAHKDRPLPNWLSRIKAIGNAQKVIRTVSPKRIYSPKLLFLASLFNLFIFSLDSASLWGTLQAVGMHTDIVTAFIALIMASIAATLSALPGGIGGFETGCVTILSVMGVPLEAALAGTILLRGFILWLPMLPGLWFARKDIHVK